MEDFTAMQNNARPYIALIVHQWLQQFGVTTVTQPAYSTDVNLQNRLIFRKFETFRHGKASRGFTENANLVIEYLQYHHRLSFEE